MPLSDRLHVWFNANSYIARGITTIIDKGINITTIHGEGSSSFNRNLPHSCVYTVIARMFDAYSEITGDIYVPIKEHRI